MSTTPPSRGPASDDARINCPHDGQLMERITLRGNLHVDRCAACGAMWFDAHELDRLMELEEDVSAVDREVDTPGRRSWVPGGVCCPRDKSGLIRVVDPKQEHVEVYTCGKCSGILLERGELLDLAEFTLKERMVHLFRRLKRS